MDTDGDGQLTKEELIAAYKKVTKKDDVENDVNQLFDKLDFNKTKAIDFSEFLVANLKF